jgi:outer membrane lipoprotein-sorting protein
MNLATMFLAAAPLLAPPTTTQADVDLRKIEQKLLELVPKFTSLSAAMSLKVDYSGTLSWDRSDGRGSVEYLIKGDQILSRVDMTSESIATVGTSEVKTRDVHTLYSDGKYVFDVGESNGNKIAFKMNADPMQVAVPTKALFEVWRTDYETKVLPDEKVDGKDCWVIEARPKNTEKTPAARMISYFRKDVPLLVKTVSYDKFDRPIQWSALTDIKINPKLDPERFVFKPSPDYELHDISEEK